MHDNILDNFAKFPENNLEKIVSLFSNKDIDVNEIFKLANILADSGENINDLKIFNTADIPSTGGPGSLTTLLCPLYLVNNGYTVIKLGIPGRPSGGIDALSQIENYQIEYNTSELKRILSVCNYIHFLTNNVFAPLDGALYAYRKSTGNVNVPNLAIASLLSKKIAMGIKNLGLDVRVWSGGNFGKSFNEARLFSNKFIRVANMAGINAKCFLSDASQPSQPYIGRGESLIAIYEILNNCASQWLQEHNEYCRNISNYMKVDLSDKKSYDIKDIFIKNLEQQNSSYEKFIEKVNMVIEEPRYDIFSSEAGYCYYNLDYIRNHIVSEQDKMINKDLLFPDPCGYFLTKRPGNYVDAGEVIASYRTNNPESVKYAKMMYFIEEKQRSINTNNNEVIQ